MRYHKAQSSGNSHQSLENSFERYYIESREIYAKEKEIEAASRRLKEKYDSYVELTQFIEYLEATEKLFARAHVKGWNDERIKDEFIRFDITLVSQDSNVDQNVFLAIFHDFKDFESDAHSITEVAGKLLEKYEQGEMQNFIEYLRDLFLGLVESMDKGETREELRNRMVRIRMESVAKKGDVGVDDLEKIYAEFRDSLQKI